MFGAPKIQTFSSSGVSRFIQASNRNIWRCWNWLAVPVGWAGGIFSFVVLLCVSPEVSGVTFCEKNWFTQITESSSLKKKIEFLKNCCQCCPEVSRNDWTGSPRPLPHSLGVPANGLKIAGLQWDDCTGDTCTTANVLQLQSHLGTFTKSVCMIYANERLRQWQTATFTRFRADKVINQIRIGDRLLKNDTHFRLVNPNDYTIRVEWRKRFEMNEMIVKFGGSS